MIIRALVVASMLAVASTAAIGAPATDARRDILVMFDNSGASASRGGAGAPYNFRKRYAITAKVRRAAASVAREHKLARIDHWPMRSLLVYCFVYRVPEGVDRDLVVAALQADERVESAQLLQKFETGTVTNDAYNDPYAKMQYGLDVLDITAAHRKTLGAGVRIAIVDSHADVDHEDLEGRIRTIEVFSSSRETADADHGTAIASVIGARSNNALGIVGIAPEATLEIFVACWHAGQGDAVVCDSFSLSKALDRVLDDPPQILNLSLTGPQDVLVGRFLEKLIDAGVIVVAASPARRGPHNEFPSNMAGVIGIGRSSHAQALGEGSTALINDLFAPGDQIMVATPDDHYDFRSGSSLAAAHVSGVVALLLSVSPQESTQSVRKMLLQSQNDRPFNHSVNACAVLRISDPDIACGQ